MIDASWLVFVVASLVLIATPGQDMILVMSRSVAQGVAAGVVTAGGVSVGLIGHTVLATLGLGAILRTSEWLFLALKLVGAAYLIYLGIGLLRTKQSSLPLGAQTARTLGRLFVDGAVSNLSNPKIAIFYFAFLPQFVSSSAAISDAHGVCPGARVRWPDVSGQGTGWHLCRTAFGLAARPARRAHLGVSFVGRNPGRLGHKAGIREALMSADPGFNGIRRACLTPPGATGICTKRCRRCRNSVFPGSSSTA